MGGGILLKPSKKTPTISLTIGSRYRVLSVGSYDKTIESRGIFRGIVSVGSVDAIALELDPSEGGLVRVIPSHVVLSIDILEAAKEEEKEPRDTELHYT